MRAIAISLSNGAGSPMKTALRQRRLRKAQRAHPARQDDICTTPGRVGGAARVRRHEPLIALRDKVDASRRCFVV